MNLSPRRIIATAALASLALAACGGGDDDADSPTSSDAPDPGTTGETMTGDMDHGDLSDLSGSVVVSGSSTVEPISIAVGDDFADIAQGVAVLVDGPGTGDGFAKFCNGETDVSDASRPIKAAEVETCAANGIEFIELPVAVDGLSVITSVENDAVECLSFVDLYALLGPDAVGVDNWSAAGATADEIAAQVEGLGEVHTPYPDADLTITAPGEESGTFDSFVEIVIEAVGGELGVEDANVRPDYTASPNDNVIIEGISANATSLGWVGFAFVEENLDVIRPLAVDGGEGCVEPTPETIAGGEFPIARELFIYVNAGNLDENPALAPFIDHYLTEGVTTMIGSGEGQVPYVALSDEALAETQRVWEARETGSRAGG